MPDSRNSRRQGFDLDARLRLLEQDADDHERAVDQMNKRLGKILMLCTSLLVSTCSAVLLLALNLVVNR